MSVGSDGGKGEGGGAGGGKVSGCGEEMLDGIEEVEQVERAERGKEWRQSQLEVHVQRRTWKEREQLVEQLVTQMETMRECCALALYFLHHQSVAFHLLFEGMALLCQN